MNYTDDFKPGSLYKLSYNTKRPYPLAGAANPVYYIIVLKILQKYNDPVLLKIKFLCGKNITTTIINFNLDIIEEL